MLEEAQAAFTRLNATRVKPLRFDLKFHFVDIESDHIQYLRRVLSERDFLTRIHRWTGMDGVRTLEVGRGSNRRGWSGLEFG